MPLHVVRDNNYSTVGQVRLSHPSRGSPHRSNGAFAIDSKRSLKKLRRLERGAGDFAGHLLYLRTLVFALTGDSHSLASAAASYGTAAKGRVDALGVITEETIDYCRQDVAVTAEAPPRSPTCWPPSPSTTASIRPGGGTGP